ncbi:MAG: phosphatidate cytidylyltransferase, partial [Flavobacteriales bacterium]
MNNILVRTLSGGVFVAIILIPLFLSREIAAGVFGVFMALGLIEFYKLFDKTESVSIDWKTGLVYGIISYCIFAFSFFGEYYYTQWMLLILAPLFFLIVIKELWREKKNPLLNVSILGFGIIYVVLPFIFMLFFILIWMNDTFAFLSGKFFGKTKLIERISPNKTWEGAIGGIIFTLLAGVIIGSLFDPEKIVFWSISAAIIAPCAIIGDLLESLFKRNANVK